MKMGMTLTAGIVRDADLLALGDSRSHLYGWRDMDINRKVSIAAFNFNVVRDYTLALTSRIALRSRGMSCTHCHDCSGLGRKDSCSVRWVHTALVGRISVNYIPILCLVFTTWLKN